MSKKQSEHQKAVWAARSAAERAAIGQNISKGRKRNPKPVSKKTRRKLSLAHRGCIPWNKGLRGVVHLTHKAKKRISVSKRGEKNPAKRPAVRAKISRTLRKKSTPEQRRRYNARKKLRILKQTDPVAYKIEIRNRIVKGMSSRHCKKAKSEFMKKHWAENYDRRSAALAKANRTPRRRKQVAEQMNHHCPAYGNPRGPRTVWYVGKCGRIAMRSKAEVRFAKKMDKRNVEWLYEPVTFQVGRNRTWTPDFLLTKEQKFVEVKGRLIPEWGSNKIAKVIRHYASTTFEIRKAA